MSNPAVRLALGLVAVLFIANLGIAESIRAALQTGSVEAAGTLAVVILGWVFTGMRK